MPKASCGRSWLNSSRHKSKAACSAFRGSNSRAISRCIRSCPPLSWGCPGRPRSKSIPRATHQTDSRLKPKSAWVCAKGAPLSLRMAWGRPYCSNKRSKHNRMLSVRASGNRRNSNRYRLYSSRTVNGSHRCRAGSYHQPLKSTVHTSLGAWPRRSVHSRPASVAGRRWRPSVKPARASIRLKLLSEAAAPCIPQIQRPDLTRAPIGMQLLEPHHLTNHLRTQLLRMPLRPARLLRQPLHAPTQQTLPPLVPRLGTYPILGTQHAKVVRAQRFHRKLNPLFHRSIRFPRHSRAYCLQPASLSVTYVLNHPCYSCSEPAPVHLRKLSGLPYLWQVALPAICVSSVLICGSTFNLQLETLPFLLYQKACQWSQIRLK